MKLSFFFLILFTISSCATQARRRGTNLAGIEDDSKPAAVSDEKSPKSKAEDRAPKGEIELGLTGDSAETVIIENAGEPEPSIPDLIESDDLKPSVKTDVSPCDKDAKLFDAKRCEELKKLEALENPKKEKEVDKSELIINAPEPE